METAAFIISAAMAGLVVLVTLGIFIWAAREDGRAQQREDEARGITPAPPPWPKPRSRQPARDARRARRARVPRDRRPR